MTNLQDGHTLVLAGHGCDEGGPYLPSTTSRRVRRCAFAVRGKTFTLRRLARRLCTGRFDLQTNESVVCPLDVELLPGSKETACPACLEATGFNPSFYYALTVVPAAARLQRAAALHVPRVLRARLREGRHFLGRPRRAAPARPGRPRRTRRRPLQERLCGARAGGGAVHAGGHLRDHCACRRRPTCWRTRGFDFGEACRALDEAVASVDVAGCFGTASDAPTNSTPPWRGSGGARGRRTSTSRPRTSATRRCRCATRCSWPTPPPTCAPAAASAWWAASWCSSSKACTSWRPQGLGVARRGTPRRRGAPRIRRRAGADVPSVRRPAALRTAGRDRGVPVALLRVPPARRSPPRPAGRGVPPAGQRGIRPPGFRLWILSDA